MLIEVDHFKALNDIYGQVEGDRCLKAITAVFSTLIRRPADSCAGYGVRNLPSSSQTPMQLEH
ncbi:diguanylate cyclase domain-containing protein [Rhizobium wenxiniae]